MASIDPYSTKLMTTLIRIDSKVKPARELPPPVIILYSVGLR